MKMRQGILWISVMVLGLTAPAQATLIDRGGGLIYDSDQNLTWLKDANYAYTNGDDSDGLMNWDAAMSWADGLSYGGYTDWRLPTVTDTDIEGCNWGYSGTDCGYNIDTLGQELAYMFHDILGNESMYNPDYSYNAADCSGAAFPYCLRNTSADGVGILNLQSFKYWSGTSYATISDHAWFFNTSDGIQTHYYKYYEFYAWAVRDGDVVPEPGTVLLLVTGLAGLLGFGRHQRRR